MAISLKILHDYLPGMKFMIASDHERLKRVAMPKGLSGRQFQWLEMLNDFVVENRHSPGELNTFAGALSSSHSSAKEGTARYPNKYAVRWTSLMGPKH
jgi:hypothetical protein